MPATAPEHDGTAPAPIGIEFQADAEAALEAVRASLGAVVRAINPPVRREPELRAALKLDKKLSWSVFTVAAATDGRAIAALLPGRRAMFRFIDAARDHGVPGPIVDRAGAALVEFESVVSRHARTREDFAAMVADLAAASEPGAVESRQRLAAFRANAVLWGRQARALLSCSIIHPSREAPGLMDRVLLRGLYGLYRTRRDTALYSVMLPRSIPTPGDPVQPGVTTPVDPREAGPNAVGLMRDFCPTPLPSFETSTAADGRRCFALVSRDVGKAAATDLVLGHYNLQCAALPGTAPGSQLVLSHAIVVPTELFVRDILIHESCWDEQLPEMRVYAPPMDGSPDAHEIDLLPVRDPVIYLGTGLGRAGTLHVPRYGELLEWTLREMGWNPDEFRVFRCAVEHPMLHSWIRLKFSR